MIEVLRNASLDRDNTLHLPCEAAALIAISSAEDVQEALDWCREEGLTPLPLGEGSNVVLPLQLKRAVLRSRDRRQEVLFAAGDDVLLRVGAGHNWHALVRDCLERGFHGLENLALIPGQVGAAPVQNIGAYGVEIAEWVHCVHAVDLQTGDAREFVAGDCGFAYRDSVFKGALRGRVMITAVDFRLRREDRPRLRYPALLQRLREDGIAEPTAREVFDAVVALRRRRLPDLAEEPNAGSFFKNPRVPQAQARDLQARFPALPVFSLEQGYVKLSAAWMIENCGFRGVREGAVGVSPRHALVLVNHGGTQQALLALAASVRAAVEARFGVRLEIEPVVYGGD